MTNIELVLEKEEEIQEKISDLKERLQEVLLTKINVLSNDYFILDDVSENYSLSYLCRQATIIQSIDYLMGSTILQPTMLNREDLCSKELNIKNMVQYCNNLLRESLKRNRINPQNCNNMTELISMIEEIDSVIVFEKYVSNVTIDNNGNLNVSYVHVNDITTSNMLTDIHHGNHNLYITSEPYNGDYENLFLDVEIDENGDLCYTKVKDALYEMGYMDEYIDIPVSMTWLNNNFTQNVTVHLLANGMEIDSVTLTSNDWGHTFIDLPKYRGENEINYTISVNSLQNGQKIIINGFNIFEVNVPDETSKYASIVWEDEDNINDIRPNQVRLTLNGVEYIASEVNGWIASAEHLSTIVNNQLVEYSWVIQQIDNYELKSRNETGALTIFTLKAIRQIDEPVPPKK